MNESGFDEERVPITEEQLRVEKRLVEKGRVRISTKINEHTTTLNESLLREDVSIERVVVDREVDDVPEIRKEGETLIIPVVEERLVLVKRLVLKEELHVRQLRRYDAVSTPVTLKSTEVSVEREQGSQANHQS